MNIFIFRNNTVEQFFGSREVVYTYSGYDDISYINEAADKYIWFYQVPIKYDNALLSREVDSYVDKLNYLLSQIPSSKQLVIFTLKDIYSTRYSADNLSLRNSIDRFNNGVWELASSHSNMKVVDIEPFFANYSKDQWIDWKYYFISQIGISPKLASKFKRWFSKKIEEIDLKRKKCLVLDLDNTLWGGILGEDGVDGIKIGGDYPGKCFSYFQDGLVELSKSGVILAICSKNNESDVFEAWANNPFIKIKGDIVSAHRINWINKADNIRSIAKELNIGLDSFVFVDDNPTERELVKQLIPEVEVPEFPVNPYELPVFLEKIISDYFCVYSITSEDRDKVAQYSANSKRAVEEAKFSNIDEYIASLEINVTVDEASELTIPRIAQMTQKTNQFNLTTKRYTTEDIKALLDSGANVYTISVSDKFGDNGITGCCIVTNENGECSIDSLLLSCRILGKKIEFAFVKFILNLLFDRGISSITAKYIPTLKNMQVSKFYDTLGFSVLSSDDAEGNSYKLEMSKKFEIESYYNIK